MKVDSSAVSEIDYDPVRRTLDVRFLEGGLYRYKRFPPSEYRRLLNADSIGNFVSTQVRDRYDFDRLDEVARRRGRGGRLRAN